MFVLLSFLYGLPFSRISSLDKMTKKLGEKTTQKQILLQHMHCRMYSQCDTHQKNEQQMDIYTAFISDCRYLSDDRCNFSFHSHSNISPLHIMNPHNCKWQICDRTVWPQQYNTHTGTHTAQVQMESCYNVQRHAKLQTHTSKAKLHDSQIYTRDSCKIVPFKGHSHTIHIRR